MNESRLCVCQPAPTLAIVDTGSYGDHGGVMELEGGSGDTFDVAVTRVGGFDRVDLHARIRWMQPPAAESWELCLAMHDPGTGDVRSALAQHGLTPWTPHRVDPPVGESYPIVPGRWYDARFTIDRTRRVYSVAIEGWLLAADVPLDGLLTMSARIAR